jgi:hypothetical protein
MAFFLSAAAILAFKATSPFLTAGSGTGIPQPGILGEGCPAGLWPHLAVNRQLPPGACWLELGYPCPLSSYTWTPEAQRSCPEAEGGSACSFQSFA